MPFAVRKRGGRKLVLAPDGAPMPPAAPHVDSTLVKAIARAFRWQKMLETGRYATIKEIAKAEKINPSYVSRVLQADAAGAGDGGGDPGWAGERGADARGGDEGVSGGVETSARPAPRRMIVAMRRQPYRTH